MKEEVGRAGLRTRQPLRPIQAKEEHKDPWETMDPDEVVTEKEKPFKKGWFTFIIISYSAKNQCMYLVHLISVIVTVYAVFLAYFLSVKMVRGEA